MKNIFWFRRDLRLEDNTGLYHALRSDYPVQCIFIFDRNILDKLPKNDARVEFIHQELTRIKNELEEYGSTLLVYYGKPKKIWKQIMGEHDISSVFTNKDFEPYAIKRDAGVQKILATKNIEFLTFKDHVIFELEEVTKDDGLPYTVFTPYKRKWLAKLETKLKRGKSYYLTSYPSTKYANNFVQREKSPMISLSEMNFVESGIEFPSTTVVQSKIKSYDKNRDYPSKDGTSKLGVHFRFGTISIREKARKAIKLNQTFLSELIWRDFYSQILTAFPHVIEGAFRPKYDTISWRNNEEEFKAWCNGITGYPIVDAGMRELNATGYMHNRVRMVVASFLTKHLLIHWSWGEAYFAEKLLDFDLASNNGGWQWAAGTGTDAAPYFRIFSPDAQTKKFDKNLKYIKKWIPELESDSYPKPIVDHKKARERCLATYKEALDKF